MNFNIIISFRYFGDIAHIYIFSITYYDYHMKVTVFSLNPDTSIQSFLASVSFWNIYLCIILVSHAGIKLQML